MIQEQIIDQATFETERLTLRPLRHSDKGMLDMHGGDRRVARMTTTIPHPLPPGASEAFIKGTWDPERTEDVWAMDGSKADLPELLGCIALERMDRDQSEIGYWIAPAVWNMGLAREALGTIMAENQQNNATIFGSVFQDNPASARVLTHCGFAYLGDAEAYSVARQATVPTWTYLRKMI
ncbi:MAG: GNAT family N-acetyltransferase [Pseudomonadota bacterium]